MPINGAELLNALEILARDRNLRVTVQESLKGGLLTGVFATIGGIVGGPVGLAAGGIIGAIGAGISGKNKYKSVVLILNEMSDDQKQELVDSVYEALRNVGPEDIVTVVPLLMASSNLQTVALNALTQYVQSNMGMQIVI